MFHFDCGWKASRNGLPEFLIGAVADANPPLAVGMACTLSCFTDMTGPPHTRRDLSMSLESRIKELSDRHKRLEAAIAAELKHPAGDEVRIHELKRKKLRLKDEIATLRMN